MFSAESDRPRRARITLGSWMKAIAALTLLSPALGEPELLGGAIKPCNRNDPALNQCLVDSINGARDKIAEGIPELGLPPLRNHFVDHVLMEEGPQELSMRMTVKNTTLIGLEDFLITGAKVDLDNLHMEIQCHIPKVNGSGLYKWNGALLTLRIRGEGPYNVYMGNVDMTHNIDFEKYDKDGATYWRIANYTAFSDWEDYHSELKNLFSGNGRLGQYVNSFINRNVKLIQVVYKQTMAQTYGAYMKRMIDPFFERVPIDKFFIP